MKVLVLSLALLAACSTEKDTTSTQTLDNLSGCLSLDAFEAVHANPSAACSDCHGSNYDGLAKGFDAAAAFDALTSDRQALLRYFRLDGTRAVPDPSTLTAKGARALETFYNDALARERAAACAASRLLD